MSVLYCLYPLEICVPIPHDSAFPKGNPFLSDRLHLLKNRGQLGCLMHLKKKKKNQNKYLKNLINSSVFYINWI